MNIKKYLAGVGALALSVIPAFAEGEGGGSSQVDLSAIEGLVDQLGNSVKVLYTGHVQPAVIGIAIAAFTISMFLIVIKFVRRGGR